MTKPTLTYFDFPASRGEECRLALHVAGVEFDDKRINREQWMALKPNTPYGSLPILELPGQPPLAHTNAILRLIGHRHGLHPKDDMEAAQHEAMMNQVEDLRAKVGPALHISAPEEKAKIRAELREEYLPRWASFTEKQIKGSPFFGGEAIQVVDIKLHMAVRWFASGVVDDIPATIFDGFPRLMGVHNAVAEHPRVVDWRARTQ